MSAIIEETKAARSSAIRLTFIVPQQITPITGSDVGPGGCDCSCAGCEQGTYHCGNVSRGCDK